MPTIFYVDAIQVYAPETIRDAQARRTSRHWCHLWTDGPVDDLHAFAARLGLRRAWFQDKPGFPHYDLVPGRRAAALAAGAEELPLRDWIKRKMAADPNWRLHTGGVVRATPVATLPPPFCPPPALPPLDLFAPRPEPLPGELQRTLLMASRFVEQHAPIVASGERRFTLGHHQLAQQSATLPEDLPQRLEAAVLAVMTATLARTFPARPELACAAFYEPGDTNVAERKVWNAWRLHTLVYNTRHYTPRRPAAWEAKGATP